MKKYMIFFVLLAGFIVISTVIWARSQDDAKRRTPKLSTDDVATTLPKEYASTSPDKDGVGSITYGQLFQNGSTTVTPLDPGSVGSLPPGYTQYLSYDIKTEAVAVGWHIVEFHVPSVSDQTIFDKLRILHWGKDPYNSRMKWIDRTILPPDPLAPDFAARTIHAKAMDVGKFAIAVLTNPQPPNTAVADLILTSSASPDPVIVGNNLTYTLNVTNKGPQAATEVILIKPLAGPYFTSATSTHGSCEEEGGTVTCDLDTLAAGASATVTIVVKTAGNGLKLSPKGEAILNMAFVTANERDPDLKNNEINTRTTMLPDSNAPPTR